MFVGSFSYSYHVFLTLIRSLFSEFKTREASDKINPSELEIVLAAQKDASHFEKIYELYFEKIFIYIHRRVKDEMLADDLTSQTFLKALININKFEYKGYALSSWLYKIATNELNMHFRKNQVAIRNICFQSAGVFEILEEVDDEAKNYRLEVVSKVLEKLEVEELQLLEWRFTEERSFKEIGYLLDITESNAKVRIYRLLDKIRKIMPKNL